MTSRQPGATPPGTSGNAGSGQHWVRLVPLALLIILGLAGLRGAVATPRWDGPLHRDGMAFGIALEVVFAILFVVTLGRIRSANQEQVPRKLRGMLLAALGAGAVIVAVATVTGLHPHLPATKPRKVGGPALRTATPSIPAPAGSKPSPAFHLPLAALLYTLLVVLLLAAIAVSIWWARGLRPSLGPREGALIVEDSEDLRDAVESGRAALRTVDDARAAIIACYLAMEQSLAERGTARGIADTPDELLARARDRGVVRGSAAARLTALFYEARFSSHPLDHRQRDAAERALDELAASLAETEAAPTGAGPTGAGGADG